MKLSDYGNSAIRGVDMAEFINRDLHELLIRMAGWFPVVSLTGPRQSGKSTLVRHTFPDYSYVTLEDPQTRRAALEDPVSFIRNRKGGLIIDEAQYAPDLFSMIQVVSDERGDAGQYILTGSQNFLMMKSIGQSLAGRVGILKLLPLSFREAERASRGSWKWICSRSKGDTLACVPPECRPRFIFPAISIPMLSAMLWACLMCAIRRSFISFCP